MSNRSLMFFVAVIVTPVFCEQLTVSPAKSVIKKKEKSASKKETKEQILDEFDTILEQSTRLIRELTRVQDRSISAVKELAMNREICSSKEKYQACQKRLEGYTQKMGKVIEEVKDFSDSLR